MIQHCCGKDAQDMLSEVVAKIDNAVSARVSQDTSLHNVPLATPAEVELDRGQI